MIPPHQLLLMPGVRLERGKDGFGQQYLTVEEAVTGGADCIIAGRGILESDNPAETAEIYRRRGWEAYLRKDNRGGKDEQ
jgi:orotidine-5'-phosphate decarboxylase